MGCPNGLPRKGPSDQPSCLKAWALQNGLASSNSRIFIGKPRGPQSLRKPQVRILRIAFQQPRGLKAMNSGVRAPEIIQDLSIMVCISCRFPSAPTQKLNPQKHTHTHVYIYIYIHICICICMSQSQICGSSKRHMKIRESPGSCGTFGEFPCAPAKSPETKFTFRLNTIITHDQSGPVQRASF